MLAHLLAEQEVPDGIATAGETMGGLLAALLVLGCLFAFLMVMAYWLYRVERQAHAKMLAAQEDDHHKAIAKFECQIDRICERLERVSNSLDGVANELRSRPT